MWYWPNGFWPLSYSWPNRQLAFFLRSQTSFRNFNHASRGNMIPLSVYQFAARPYARLCARNLCKFDDYFRIWNTVLFCSESFITSPGKAPLFTHIVCDRGWNSWKAETRGTATWGDNRGGAGCWALVKSWILFASCLPMIQRLAIHILSENFCCMSLVIIK